MATNNGKTLTTLLITLLLGSYAFTAAIAWRTWEIGERVAAIEQAHEQAFVDLARAKLRLDHLERLLDAPILPRRRSP